MSLMPEPSAWPWLSSATHFSGACAAATVGAWLFRRRERFGNAGTPLVASLAAVTACCLTALAVGDGMLEFGGEGAIMALALALRNLAFLVTVYRLFASDGRHTSFAPVRPVVVALGFATVMLPLALFVERRMLFAVPMHLGLVFHLDVMLGMLVTIGSLVLVHNLYVGAAQSYRAVLRWPTSALALVWVYELNLYTAAYLSGRWPDDLAAIHGVVDLAFAVIVGIGASRGREELRLRPSRAVTFHSLSLLLIGAYFLAMVAVSQWLAYAGGDYARWLQFGFLIAGVASALLVLPSRRMRAWLRVTVAKHLFQHRYDYRGEWLRFTRTIGRPGKDAVPLHQRAIQALADITDSPAGLLLAPSDHGGLELAAHWQWHDVEVPAAAMSAAGAAFIETRAFIIDLDRVRAGHHESDADTGAAEAVPSWLLDDAKAWAVVPLLHFERLIGAVILARPPHARRLDWEDFDLLRVVGQQLASYLAENAGQEALTEAARFDDFHRRIAFVMHDIKNLASQFSLLARNAERHAENPAFRADMLVTLRNSAEKLNTLVARLSRYGTSVEKVEPVEVGAVARAVAAQFAARYAESRPVTVIEREPCVASANRESLEQVLVHLVQNGVDASADRSPVFIAIASDPIYSLVEIIDSGCGMSPEFVRNRLFRPFDSSKTGGFGIGAYEARELVRAMGGRLDVESREGLGTRFIIRLPLASSGALIRTFEQGHDNNGQKVA